LIAIAAAVGLAVVGGWVASTTHARFDAATDVRIDPFLTMTHAVALPTEHIVDFSNVFE